MTDPLGVDPGPRRTPLSAEEKAPDVEFPRLNNATMFEETFGKRVRRLSLAEAAPILGVLAATALVGGLALRRTRRSRRVP